VRRRTDPARCARYTFIVLMLERRTGMGDCATAGLSVRRALARTTLIAALSVGASALAGIEAGNQNGIAFESGGWSGETADVIHAHAGKFPVMLVFAWTDGTYVADVGVKVMNRKGDKVLDLNESGPLVLLGLPQGEYTINVERNGKVQSRRVNVAANTRTKAVFHWPRDTSGASADADGLGRSGSTTAKR